MAAKDYQICCAYIAKFSKRDPNLMTDDRKQITENEICGLIDWYLDRKLEKGDDYIYFKSHIKEGYNVKISYIKE